MRILEGTEQAGTAREVIRKRNISEQTLYRWKNLEAWCVRNSNLFDVGH